VKVVDESYTITSEQLASLRAEDKPITDAALAGLVALERQRDAFIEAEVRRVLERGGHIAALSTRTYQQAPGRVDLLERGQIIASTWVRLQTSSDGEPVAHVLEGRRVSWRARIGRRLADALAWLSKGAGQ